MKIKFTGLVALALLAAPMAANAALTYDFTETGGNVVGTLGGTLDLTGQASSATSAFSGSDFIQANEGRITGTAASCAACLGFVLTSTAGAFGSGGNELGSYTGDTFALSPLAVFLDPSFASGGALSGVLTFAGQTFSSLGITPGTYTATLANDTITVTFGATAVPEPGTLALLGLGLAGLVLSRRRKA